MTFNLSFFFLFQGYLLCVLWFLEVCDDVFRLAGFPNPQFFKLIYPIETVVYFNPKYLEAPSNLNYT